MSLRTLLLGLVFFLPHAGSAAAQDMTVYQLLSANGHTFQSDDVGDFTRNVIRTELASDNPAFCPQNGRRSVDATALLDFALTKAPTTADQKSIMARSVIIDYLTREYPCR